MRVIGLDLSLTSTGIAVIENGVIVDTHNVKSSGKKGDGYPEFMERIYNLNSSLSFLLSNLGLYDADLVVIEAPSHGSKFGNPHERAGLWWKTYERCWASSIPVATVAPTTRAKYITGSGKADKKEVLDAARATYGASNIPNHDIADAVGLAAMASRAMGFPVEADVTDAQLSAFNAVKWPSVVG